MRVRTAAALIVVLAAGIWALGSLTVKAQGNSNNITMLDDCDPSDPNWPAPGCFKRGGDVTLAEFFALLTGPGGVLFGHPSWRNEPSHLTARQGRTVRVRNDGGRGHTFNKVVAFAGGTIGDLNAGLPRADGCPASPDALAVVVPGGSIDVTGLGVGLHQYQCCIHPWMRATIRVE